MCIVCVDWQAGKLTNKEALRNLGEMINTTDLDKEKVAHYFATVDKIMEKELPQSETDDELDGKWWQNTHGDE